MNKGQFDKWLTQLMESIIFDVDANDGNFTEYQMGEFDALAKVRDKLRSE